MKDNPRKLEKSSELISRSVYNKQAKALTQELSDKILIPYYDKQILTRNKTGQNIFFSIFFVVSSLTFFSIFNFSLEKVFIFSFLSMLFVPLLYLLFDKKLEKVYNNGTIDIDCYLTSFFDKKDLLLVHKYCKDDYDLWTEAVVDAEYYGSEKAKEYAIEILNLAKLRKNKEEENKKGNLANKWSENIEYAKTKHVVEQELV